MEEIKWRRRKPRRRKRHRRRRRPQEAHRPERKRERKKPPQRRRVVAKKPVRKRPAKRRLVKRRLAKKEPVRKRPQAKSRGSSSPRYLKCCTKGARWRALRESGSRLHTFILPPPPMWRYRRPLVMIRHSYGRGLCCFVCCWFVVDAAARVFLLFL